MKTLKQLTVFSALFFIVSACATTSAPIAEKYDLDDQLEPVSEVVRYNLMDWNAIDSQSFILQTAPNQFYLIVLNRPADQLMFTETIGISHTGADVKPGYDKVTVYSSPKSEDYVIHKIYKLKDREEADAIREQLKG